MRILAIDFGDKRIGLAVSDRLGITAQALGGYTVKNKKEDRHFFQELVRLHEISEIVIGLPLRMDGTEGERVQKTKVFAEWLSQAVDKPIVYWDERLTTREALRVLNQRKANHKDKKRYKDQISATIILSAYLESKR